MLHKTYYLKSVVKIAVQIIYSSLRPIKKKIILVEINIRSLAHQRVLGYKKPNDHTDLPEYMHTKHTHTYVTYNM